MMAKIIIGGLVLISLISIPFAWTWRRFRKIKQALKNMDRYHYDR